MAGGLWRTPFAQLLARTEVQGKDVFVTQTGPGQCLFPAMSIDSFHQNGDGKVQTNKVWSSLKIDLQLSPRNLKKEPPDTPKLVSSGGTLNPGRTSLPSRMGGIIHAAMFPTVTVSIASVESTL